MCASVPASAAQSSSSSTFAQLITTKAKNTWGLAHSTYQNIIFVQYLPLGLKDLQTSSNTSPHSLDKLALSSVMADQMSRSSYMDSVISLSHEQTHFRSTELKCEQPLTKLTPSGTVVRKKAEYARICKSSKLFGISTWSGRPSTVNGPSSRRRSQEVFIDMFSPR